MSVKVKGYTEKIFTQDEVNEILESIEDMVGDLGWEYDRMSSSGQETYDKLVVLTNIQVYEDVWIKRDESSLTVPKIILDLNEQERRKVSLSYIIQEQPNFEMELS